MRLPQKTFFLAGTLVLLGGAPLQSAWFIRGDADSSGSVNIVDAIQILQALFLGERMPLGCLDAADSNDNGAVDLSDAAYLLSHLFLQGPRPGPKDLFTGCWPNRGGLGCEKFPACNMGIFYCLDRSGWMDAESKLNRLKQDVTKGIVLFSENDQFAITFFDEGLMKFPLTEEPASATNEMKAAGIQFVMSRTYGSGSCPLPALIAALQFAEKSTAQKKMIVLYIGSHPWCPGFDAAEYMALVLTTLAEVNPSGIPINIVGIGSTWGLPEDWLREIARQNNGSYARLQN